jgi:hypothetical protein
MQENLIVKGKEHHLADTHLVVNLLLVANVVFAVNPATYTHDVINTKEVNVH